MKRRVLLCTPAPRLMTRNVRGELNEEAARGRRVQHAGLRSRNVRGELNEEAALDALRAQDALPARNVRGELNEEAVRNLGRCACFPARLPAEVQKPLQMYAPPIQRPHRRLEVSRFPYATHYRFGTGRLTVRQHQRWRVSVRLHCGMVCH